MNDIIKNIFIINAPIELCEKWEGLELSAPDPSNYGISDAKFTVIPHIYSTSFQLSIPNNLTNIEAMEFLLDHSMDIFTDKKGYTHYCNIVIFYNIKNRKERTILETLTTYKKYEIANIKFHLLLDNAQYLPIDSFMESYLNELQAKVNCRQEYALTGWAIDKLKIEWKAICKQIYGEEAIV